MNTRSSGETCRRASIVGRSALVVALVAATGPASAAPQAGRPSGNQRPAQPVNSTNPYAAAYGRGRYTPLPVKDSTAADRAELAARAYRTALDEWAQRVLAPQRPGGPPGEEVLFSPELAERLGRWSLRWRAAQDNAAKSLALRYQALSEHLGRMDALEAGSPVREATRRTGLLTGRTVEPEPPPDFAEIARFFRPVDGPGVDQIVSELVEVERPLNPRGIAVTAAERAEIASRAYRTILDDAVARLLASRGAGRRDEGAIFDTALAERLGAWSDAWREAEDAAVTDPSWRAAAARDRSARPAWAGVRLAGPDPRPDAIRAHIERMRAMEDGRALSDAIKRAGGPADGPGDISRLRDFVDVARFFRIEAECRLPVASRPSGPDATASGRAAAAGGIFRAIRDEATHRYLETPRAAGTPTDARLVFDARLAERLGSWSIRWGRAQAGAGEGFASRFAAIRAHIERMAAMEDGRSLRNALERAGPDVGGVSVPPTPREFAEVARFFRLQALWELERLRSR